MLPQGISLRVAVDDIDLSRFSTAIIVENLDVFDARHKVKLQDELSQSLVIYRGHDNVSAKGLKRLLADLPPDIEVVMFADLDPKGLEICITTSRVSAVLAPSLADIQQLLVNYSQTDVFLPQVDSLNFLAKQQMTNWQPLVNVVVSYKLALMQQVFVALQLSLICYK